MREKVVTVQNSLGLHLRTAGMFAQTAGHFVSNIYLQKGLMKVNAKSIMGIMMLAAGEGTELTITTDGADEEEAIEELTALIESGFHES
ncbi:MAG: HPr family phosphocarrier protein [Candidatus Poribacteria bacterium]|nr:HPr family phosphocarrier protein [Candidatus Poribacteria bacterium]